ncbi:MAG: hypothetical protein RDV48_22295 [Candidatus Eremiobacteraeota bacterium]|nr:hypothetical protein [Candidatus Eremiobacteraeota bacterium]
MEESLIIEKLKALRNRFRKVLFAERTAQAALYGTASSILILICLKLVGFGTPETLYSLVPLCITLLIPAGMYFFQQIPLMKIALITDEKLRMKERLSTVLEWVTENKKRTLMFKGLLKDAAANAQKISAERTFPFTVPRQAQWLILTAPLVVILLATPPWGLIKVFTPPREAQQLKAVTAKLDLIAQNLEKKAPKTQGDLEIRKKSAELRKLSENLKKPGVGKKEAMAKIAGLSEKLREEQKKAELQKNLIDKLRGGSDGRSRGGEAKDSAPSEKLRQMAKDLKNPALGEKGAQALKEELEKMKNLLSENSSLQKELSEALARMEKKDHGGASEKLEEAAAGLEKMEAGLKSDRELSKLVKDLERCKSQMASDDGLPSGETAGEDAAGEQGEGGEDSPGSADGERGSDGKAAKEASQVSQKYTKSGEKKPGDYGVGSTNKEQKGQENSPDYFTERQSSKTSHWNELYEKFYDAERHEKESALTKVKGQRSGSQGAILSKEVKGGIPAAGTIENNPRKLYAAYKGKAEESVGKEKIPREYRALVKDYFKEIEPGK